MPRIRTIKPDAFTSESLSRCTPLARWTFAGLWCYSDDAGKSKSDIRLLKANIFPLDDATNAPEIEGAIGELIEEGCIHTYMSGGRQFLHIPEFLRHQKINRPTPSTLPLCPCEQTFDHGRLTEDSLSPQRGKGREGKGNGKGGGREDTSGVATPPTPTPTKRPPRKCPAHISDPNPPACGACADARRLHDEWKPPTFSAKTTMCGIHPKHPANKCPECAAEVKPAPEGWRGRRTKAK